MYTRNTFNTPDKYTSIKAGKVVGLALFMIATTTHQVLDTLEVSRSVYLGGNLLMGSFIWDGGDMNM